MATNESDGRVVHCRRVDQDKTVEEHLSCPYCFGKADQISGASHDRFCSYDPDRDPIVYGFPPDTARNNNM